MHDAGWARQTEFIDTWINELEMLVYEFDVERAVLDESRRLLIRAVDAGITAGRKGASVALACFYLACRMKSEFVPLNRLLKAPLGHGISRTEMASTVRILIRDLQIPGGSLSLRPEQYLTSILRVLKKDGRLDHVQHKEKLAERAERILQKSSASHRGGNHAILAAACLYVAAKDQDETLMEKSLAEAAGSSDVALRTYVKSLREMEL